jgi:hypothetical protein
MIISCHQTVGQNYYIKVDDKYIENVAKFKYLRTKAANKICFHEEIKNRLNSEIACYHADQNRLSSLVILCVKVRLSP